ncbi:DNA polymerase [bacterium]|nr:DNA polymerase [bacterium]
MTDIPEYQMVSSKTALAQTLRKCIKAGPTALDFETTSLVPAEGRARLVSLCNDHIHALVDFDQIKGGFRAVAHLFEKGTWVVFNAGFEQRWFMDAGTVPKIWDVANMRKAVLGGGNYKLKQLVKWDLDIDMSKEEQASDWGAKVLTQSQLDYAYLDADRTWKLWLHWSKQADMGRWGAFGMINDMVPAVIEMEDSGMLLDVKYHQTLIDAWEKARDERVASIREMVTEDEVKKINSNVQWSDYFARNMPDSFLRGWPRTEKSGHLSMTNETLKMLAGFAARENGSNMLTVFLDTLSEYKTITKYLSSFGDTLITKSELSRDKRVRARFNIGAAKTVRFSCSGPNLQQIPRDRELLGTVTSIRRGFVAGLGRKLVSYDYSGIELRVLALLSGDAQLLEDMITGDVHSEVASKVAGRVITKASTKKSKADKDARQAAKAVSFGIIYGAGASGLSSTMRTTVHAAEGYIEFWQQRYPKAFDLRYQKMQEAEKSRYIRCIDGGTIYMGKKVELPKCANYPVQRAALSIMARAIARHKASLDEARANRKQRMTRMLSTIHDALIDEASSRDAEECMEMMFRDMTLGYTDVFPNAPTEELLEGGIGPNWAELEDV